MIEFRGLLPVKDQPGAHGFQDGVGVNMRGDVAIETSIYNAPKMGELSINTAWAGMVHELATGTEQSEGGRDTRYAKYKRDLADIERRGLEQYFIRRTPGIRLTGGTVWTFDRTGEVRQECAFGVSAAIHGVQLDEDGEVYCVITDRSLRDGKPFLAGRGSTLGRKENIVTPHTGTLVKTRNGGGQILFETTPVPMDATEFPQRPPDVETPPYCDGRGWVEGVSWLYAGASPIVHQGMCYCPTQRLHLDWFKRVYVPEGYRHSIGILDTAGNVILHLGRYGNWDDAVRMKPGDTDMVNTQVRFIGGTDNYLCFQDWGERLQAWKLNYHAEETVEIGRK